MSVRYVARACVFVQAVALEGDTIVQSKEPRPQGYDEALQFALNGDPTVGRGQAAVVAAATVSPRSLRCLPCMSSSSIVGWRQRHRRERLQARPERADRHPSSQV